MKSKVIKYSFLILSLVYIVLIFVLDSNFIYEFLKSLITYIWYPNYVLFIITIIVSIIILIWDLLNKKNNLFLKIINYLLFAICFSCYISFLRLDIDPLLYSSLYSNNSLLVMRIVTISFMIWIVVNMIIKIRGRK